MEKSGEKKLSWSLALERDFLVNYAVIDKWMDKNNIELLLIPSFSPLINPFRSKFDKIVHSSNNLTKTFIFANIAEYGGSGIFNFKRRNDYEPGREKPFKPREEKLKSFTL